MAAPAWFDAKTYFNNKLESMGAGWDSLALKKAFEDAGFTVDFKDDDSLYSHFEQFGKYEGVSPSPLFNTEEYLYSKAAQYYGRTDVTPQEVESMRLAIEGANLNPWDHYMLHGWAEGVNPSAGFDSKAYMNAKLAQLQKDEPGNGWDMASLEQAFKDQGYSALTHYFVHGQYENLSYEPDGVSPGTPGSTQNLTPGDDYLYGTNGDDYFSARPGTLGDRDYIDGMGGNDTLYAYVGGDHNGDHDAGAITPVVKNVENIIFRAQRTGGTDGGDNAIDGFVAIDAGDIEGMQYLGNDNSRASLRVEDVRTDSPDLTVAWTNADPGRDVDYEVYFNPPNLIAEGAKSGVIQLEIMDAHNGEINDPPQPLKEWPWDQFRFDFEANDGTASKITLTFLPEDDAKWHGPTATYETLVEAFENAIADLVKDNPQYANTFVVELGSQYTGSASSGGSSWTYDEGYRVVIKSTNGSVSAAKGQGNGWFSSAGSGVEVDGGITWNIDTVSTHCPLIQTNIELDNVGRVKWDDASDCLPNNDIYGSEAGDMVVGSMANRGGVERFDVKVGEGSWISSLSSTNEALRMVKVENLNANQSSQLFIGEQLAHDAHYALHEGNNAGLNSSLLDGENLFQWTDRAHLLSTKGLVDVKYFEGSGFNGNLNIGASLTEASFQKYLRDVDGVESMAGNYAPDGNFVYNLSNQADVLNMHVDGGVAADRDFVLDVNAGGGNDFINFSLSGIIWNQAQGTYVPSGPTANQVINSNDLGNIKLSGGAGSDTIKVWENAAVTVDGGSDNDVIFVSQTVTDQNAVFIFNAVAGQRGIITTNEGAQSLENDILSIDNSFTVDGLALNTEYVLKVNFKGIETAVNNISLGRADANGELNLTAEQINMAIIKAINNDPTLSELLVAKDGAGRSLLVESLIDGEMVQGDLSLNFYSKVGNTLDRVNNLFTGLTDGGTAYETNFATDGHAGLIVDGTDDGTFSLNKVEGGAGNDLIVLNADSIANTWFDTLLLTDKFGDDIVVNYEVGVDQIDVTKLMSTNSDGVAGELINYSQAAAGDDANSDGVFSQKELFDIVSGSGNSSTTANANSVGYVQHGENGIYTFFQIKNDGNTDIAEKEINILGTISFADTGGFDNVTLTNADFITI